MAPGRATYVRRSYRPGAADGGLSDATDAENDRDAGAVADKAVAAFNAAAAVALLPVRVLLDPVAIAAAIPVPEAAAARDHDLNAITNAILRVH